MRPVASPRGRLVSLRRSSSPPLAQSRFEVQDVDTAPGHDNVLLLTERIGNVSTGLRSNLMRLGAADAVAKGIALPPLPTDLNDGDWPDVAFQLDRVV